MILYIYKDKDFSFLFFTGLNFMINTAYSFKKFKNVNSQNTGCSIHVPVKIARLMRQASTNNKYKL